MAVWVAALLFVGGFLNNGTGTQTLPTAISNAATSESPSAAPVSDNATSQLPANSTGAMSPPAGSAASLAQSALQASVKLVPQLDQPFYAGRKASLLFDVVNSGRDIADFGVAFATGDNWTDHNTMTDGICKLDNSIKGFRCGRIAAGATAHLVVEAVAYDPGSFSYVPTSFDFYGLDKGYAPQPLAAKIAAFSESPVGDLAKVELHYNSNVRIGHDNSLGVTLHNLGRPVAAFTISFGVPGGRDWFKDNVIPDSASGSPCTFTGQEYSCGKADGSVINMGETVQFTLSAVAQTAGNLQYEGVVIANSKTIVGTLRLQQAILP